MIEAVMDMALARGASFELTLLVKATLVTTLGLAVVAIARRARASRRHLVLASTFCALVGLPVVAGLATPVGIPMPAVLQHGTVTDTAPPAGPAYGLGTLAGRAVAVDDPALDRGWALSPIALLRTAWMVGAMLFLLPAIVTTWRIRLLRRTGLPWLGVDSLVAGLARSVGVRRYVLVLLHEGVESPMTYGAWRPSILLPFDAPRWSAGDVQRVLLHELEHVRRADWPMHLIARATCAFYWFHPLAWMTWRRLHLEAERACDDAVACRTDRRAYAEQLVMFAQRLSRGIAPPLLAMAARGDLSHRVRAVLDDGQARGRAGGYTTLAAGLVVLVMVAGIAPLRVVSARQTPVVSSAAPKPVFEVASIKRNLSGPPGSNANSAVLTPVPGGGFKATNSTLESIIRYVYGMPAFGSALREDQLMGGPDWVRTDRFDIDAKAARDVPRDETFRMVQALLEERFRLVLGAEQRDKDIYALMLARTDGRLGPDLRHSEESDCAARREAARAAGVMLLPSTVKPAPRFGTRTSGACSPIASLATGLQRTMRTTVIDRTGLTGLWDYSLTYLPDRGLRPVPGLEARPKPGDVEEAPPLFTALQEQLGLKLEKQRGPVDVLVIKSVQLLTEN